MHDGILIRALWIALATHPLLAQNSGEAFVVKIPGANMTSSITLSASNGIGSPGQTVEIPIHLACKGTAAPATFQLDLDFDQQKLAFTSARVGAQLAGASKGISSSLLSNGDVRLLTSGMNQTVIGDGIVAYASFTLKGAFLSGTTAVAPLNCAAASASGGALATACTSATITTLGCDINADGSVNVQDVQVVINEAMGMSLAVHDFNQDGAVNIIDVQKMINAAFGSGCG